MTPAEFDARLHELLDRRLDPLDDPDCRAFLDAHPHRLPDFAALRLRLAALPHLAEPVPAPVPTPRPWRRLAPWWSLAAAAAIALWLARPTPAPAPAAAAPAAPEPAAAPRGRVLAAALEPIHQRLGAVATAQARAVLLDRPDARLETFVQWSSP